MIIDCVSDLHGYYPKLEGGDLLIVAGDLTARDTEKEHVEFSIWLEKQSYRKTIFIAGNHDNYYEKFYKTADDPSISYLCDSGTEFEGLKIWGSPWTAAFPGINPKCMAFTEAFGTDTDYWLEEHWNQIPNDTDILITHSPPHGILDKVNRTGEHVGSVSLRNKVMKISSKLHVFGHIHECGGNIFDTTMTKFVNASIVNEKYQHVNKPIRIELDI